MKAPEVIEYLKKLNKTELEKLLNELGVDCAEKRLMVQKYIYKRPLSIICTEFPISQQTAYNWHGKIIKMLAKIL